MLQHRLVLTSLVVGLVAVPALPAAAAPMCAVQSMSAEDGSGNSVSSIVPPAVIPPGSSLTVHVRIDPSASSPQCLEGVMEARLAPDGRMLDRPWIGGGLLDYALTVPHDLKGGPDQQLIITTRSEAGSLPIATIAFRWQEDTSTANILSIGPSTIVDGKLVMCADQPDACAEPPQTPTAEAPMPVPSLPVEATSASIPSAEEELTEFTAEKVPAATAPSWLWPTLVGVTAALGAVFMAVRIARARDHAARLRRMAERD